MSPGGLNSVGWAESGVDACALAGLLGLLALVLVALGAAESDPVGADDGLLEEPHPVRAAADMPITLAMVTAVAATADRGVVMHSTLRTGFPVDGQRKVSFR
jgi:hypothetical protein